MFSVMQIFKLRDQRRSARNLQSPMAFLTPARSAKALRDPSGWEQHICSRRLSKRVQIALHTREGFNKRPTMVRSEALPDRDSTFSTQGMTVEQFFKQSIGQWRSQRSSHNLAWAQFEQITSEITICELEEHDTEIVELCKNNQVDVKDMCFRLKMSWEGESDWDEEVSEGQSVMGVVKDGSCHGRLLRSVGYAETIPAIGKWEMTDEGMFVLNTFYEAAAAEERIWFATPDLRLRVSQIRTSSGRGVLTASFSSEIRRLNLE